MGRELDDARATVLAPAVPLVEAPRAHVVLEHPEAAALAALAAQELEPAIVKLDCDAGAPPGRHDVQALEPFGAQERGADGLAVGLGDQDRRARVRERARPALEDRVAGEWIAIRREDVRERGDRGPLLDRSQGPGLGFVCAAQLGDAAIVEGR